MYWFGKDILPELNDKKTWEVLKDIKSEYFHTPIERIISILDGFSHHLSNNTEFYKNAELALLSDLKFSRDEIRKSLNIIPSLFAAKSLEVRLEAEVGIKFIDSFSKVRGSLAKSKAIPLGIVSHITASNVFLSAVDSLIMGLITKNINIVKLSSGNERVIKLIAHYLRDFDKESVVFNKFSLLVWKGGDEEIETLIKKHSNIILAWGGEEMIKSYRRDLPLDTSLIELGPKFSFQVITQNGLINKSLSKVADAIVSDIIPWNQRACSAPQNLFIENGIDLNDLIKHLKISFSKASQREGVSDNEYVEIQKEMYRSLYSQFIEEGQSVQGNDYLIHFEKDPFPRPGPSNRTLIIKPFSNIEELAKKLSSISYYLQTCSFLVSSYQKKELLEKLSEAGVVRFTNLGHSSIGFDGAPHDGVFLLSKLVKYISFEESFEDLTDELITNDSVTLKKQFDSSEHPAGPIFSSGGTTGEPKYVHFSNDEFCSVSDLLARNLKGQGISRGMVVANLFVPGNMWSSFIAVDRALEKLGVVNLPIGGMSSVDNIIHYLIKFKPSAILGIPSLLLLVAQKMKSQNISVNVPMIFYAGERLGESRQEYFRDVWGVQYFGSAGYASVDAGVIGYQCPMSRPGEHHLFSEYMKLDVIDGQAVVTPLNRNTLDLRNYQTGDEVELLNPCECGSKDQKFLLKGRIDDLIHIWSARIRLHEIESVLKKYSINTYRLVLSFDDGRELLKLIIESDLVFESLLFDLYQMNQDLQDSISYIDFMALTTISYVSTGEIQRNVRTGKISLVQDLRQ